MTATKAKKYSSDRRERMAELQAEGKLTPEHGKLGGRPRKSSVPQQKRSSQVIAEWARENPEKLVQVFIDVLTDDDASRGDKLRAVKQMVGIEVGESDRERDELADPQSAMSQAVTADVEQAKDRLSSMLADPITGARLRDALSGLVADAGSTPAITP